MQNGIKTKTPITVLLVCDFLVRIRKELQFCPFQQQTNPLVGKGRKQQIAVISSRNELVEATDVATSLSKIKIIADH